LIRDLRPHVTPHWTPARPSSTLAAVSIVRSETTHIGARSIAFTTGC
jgi:hypothetical protein